jgi:hypothetical protein
MKVFNWRKKILASLVAAGMLTPATALAVNIPLGDPSFETYVVPSRGYAYAADPNGAYRPSSPWIDDQDMAGQDDFESNWLYNASFAETGSATRRGAPRTGNQAMHTRFHYSTQTVANVFEAGKTYTFSIYAQGNDDVEDPPEPTGSDIWLYVFDGSDFFSEDASLKFARYQESNGDFIRRPDNVSAAQSRALWQKISISHTVHSDSPELGHTIGVGFYGNGDGSVDDASLSVDVTVLTLLVNTTNGQTRIVNETGAPVHLNYYEIASANNSLNKNGWVSFQDVPQSGFPSGNGTGNGWEEVGGGTGTSDALLSEAYLLGNSQLSAAAFVGLGAAYMPGDPQDLVFRYGQVPRQSLTADFDADSDVDGADFLRWQRGFGSFGPTVTTVGGNANTDLTVNAEDFDAWRTEFGNRAIATANGFGVRGHVRYVAAFPASAVPEPASIALVGLGIAGASALRRTARCEKIGKR